jgi:hypothetical protein
MRNFDVTCNKPNVAKICAQVPRCSQIHVDDYNDNVSNKMLIRTGFHHMTNFSCAQQTNQ